MESRSPSSSSSRDQEWISKIRARVFFFSSLEAYRELTSYTTKKKVSEGGFVNLGIIYLYVTRYRELSFFGIGMMSCNTC